MQISQNKETFGMRNSTLLDPPSKESFAFFCRTLYERRLVAGVGGNVSARDKDKFMVTPSGFSLRDITPETVVSVERDGSIQNGSIPSKEFQMHRRIFERRKGVNIVCHVHGSYIISVSSILPVGPTSLPPLTPGFALLAYPLPLVPFFLPGSAELADVVDEYFADKKRRSVLLKNHGLITVGNNMAEALNIAEEIEEAAHIYILTDGRGSIIDKNLVSKIF